MTHTIDLDITFETRKCPKCKGTGERGFHAADGMGCKRCGATGIVRTLPAQRSWDAIQAKRVALTHAPYVDLYPGMMHTGRKVLYVGQRDSKGMFRYALEGADQVRPNGTHVMHGARVDSIRKVDITDAIISELAAYADTLPDTKGAVKPC